MSQRQRVRVSTLLGGIALVAGGCNQEVQSPSTSEQVPALAATSSAALTFRQLSAGYRHTCGVTTDNKAYCWGADYDGQLGDGGSGTIRTRPVPVAGGLSFLQVSGGYEYTCGITTNFKAYCWGQNQYGKLGDGSSTRRLTPVAVLGGHSFRQVDPGAFHTCAVTTSDAAYCWGWNRHGRLGTGLTYVQRQKPVAVAGGLLFRRVSTAGSHACGLIRTENRMYCWGENDAGQRGGGATMDAWTPKLVFVRFRWDQVGTGSGAFGDVGHSCGISTDDRPFCWGFNADGQMGTGFTNNALRPAAVSGNLLMKAISLGSNHTCGVTTENQAYCWGQAYWGQLGNGSYGIGAENQLSPVAVSGGLSFKAIAVGETHSCGLTPEGLAYCWGTNADGQLGDGTQQLRPTPVAVAGP
jgi:alpha-tubulin suppressor-like RCC1 family protein